MRFRIPFLCLALLFLTGWGHLGPKVKIGLSIDHTQGREIFLKSMRDESDETNADLLLKDASDDPVAQENQVKDLTQKGIQVLVVIPCDPFKAGPLVAAAHQSGIKVIALDQAIPDSFLDYFIDFNWLKEGELQAQAIVNKVPKGHYVFFGGDDDDLVYKNIQEGWMRVLQPLIDRGDIQISASIAGGSDTMEAAKSINRFLEGKESKVDAILTSNHSLAEMALQALEIKKLSGKVAVAGMGEDLATCRRIVSGTQTVTIYHPPQRLAEETVYLAAKLARKATTFDCQFVELPNGQQTVKAVLLTPAAVDAKNLDSTIIHDGVLKREDVYGK